MKFKDVILASQSPRRREMFDRLAIDYIATSADTDETVLDQVSPAEYVKILAKRKGEAVISAYTAKDFVISADTVVALGEEIFGKPTDANDAFRMLKAFSGNVHKVYTAFSICHGGRCYVEAVATEVHFRTLTDREITYYIEKEKPFDKAGAYGIQGIGAKFIEEIEGDYFNVVGLPLSKLYQVLKKDFGVL